MESKAGFFDRGSIEWVHKSRFGTSFWVDFPSLHEAPNPQRQWLEKSSQSQEERIIKKKQPKKKQCWIQNIHDIFNIIFMISKKNDQNFLVPCFMLGDNFNPTTTEIDFSSGFLVPAVKKPVRASGQAPHGHWQRCAKAEASDWDRSSVWTGF